LSASETHRPCRDHGGLRDRVSRFCVAARSCNRGR